MKKYYDSVEDVSTGRPVANAEVAVYDSMGNLADLFSDDGITSINNPILTDQTGFFSFFVADGFYTIEVSYNSAVKRSISNVEIIEAYPYPGLSDGEVTNAKLDDDAVDARVLADEQILADHLTSDPTELAAIKSKVFPTAAQPEVVITDFGGDPTGNSDDTAAIDAAMATGKIVFFPYGTYNYHGYLAPHEGALIGEGWGIGVNAKWSSILFHDCIDPEKGAIQFDPTGNSDNALFPRIENIRIAASSWDGGTGCLGYGIKATTPILMRNVWVSNFKKSNLFFHQQPGGGGPYRSLIENVYSTRSGERGILVGAGANDMTFINPICFWNGAPSFGTAPSEAGSWDGFEIINDADGLAGISSYTPEGISIIGGDCSYNSRYGWNLGDLRNSGGVFPGYAENNYVKDARIGNVDHLFASFGRLGNFEDGFQNDANYSPYYYSSEVRIGGKRVHPADIYGLVANPATTDHMGGVMKDAPARNLLLSRDNTNSQNVRIGSNMYPGSGSPVDPATETVASILLFGANSACGIGGGEEHLEIRRGRVILPKTHYHKTAPGWGAAAVTVDRGTAAPVSGTYARGSFRWNNEPSAAGTLGWVCVTAGTPGTWKAVSGIAA